MASSDPTGEQRAWEQSPRLVCTIAQGCQAVSSRGRLMPRARRGIVLVLLPLAGQLAISQSAPTSVEGLLSQASAMEQRKNYSGAERAYRQALLFSPDDPEILMRLGVAYQM